MAERLWLREGMRKLKYLIYFVYVMYSQILSFSIFDQFRVLDSPHHSVICQECGTDISPLEAETDSCKCSVCYMYLLVSM
jgi:hypothetical protein